MKQQKPSIEKVSSLKISWAPLVIVGGAILLLGSLIIAVTILNSIQAKSTKEQVAFEQYLEKKYNSDFTVERPRLTSSGLGVEGVWKTTAYPINSKSLSFNVSSSQKLTSFSDQYIAAIWSQEQTDQIQPEVERIYGNTKDVTVGVKVIFSGDLAKDATLKSPTYEEAKIMYADGLLYELVVNATRKINPTSDAEKLYKLIELGRSQQLKMVDFIYYDRSSKEAKKCSLGESQVAKVTSPQGLEACLTNMSTL